MGKSYLKLDDIRALFGLDPEYLMGLLRGHYHLSGKFIGEDVFILIDSLSDYFKDCIKDLERIRDTNPDVKNVI